MNIRKKILRLGLSALAIGGIGAGVTGTIAESRLLEPISAHANENCPNSPNPQPDLDELERTLALLTCVPTPTPTPGR